jgi:hypothetical protein
MEIPCKMCGGNHATGACQETQEIIGDKIDNPEVSAADISITPPEIGGSLIIMQRHEKYNRKKESGETKLGSLTPESAQSAYNQTKELLNKMFGSLTDEEKTQLHFLVVASDTTYKNQGKRSVETAEQILAAIRSEIQDRALSDEVVENNHSGAKKVAEIARIEAPRFLEESIPYHNFLVEKYGEQTPEFWKAFEEDTHKEERLKFKAEGPNEIDLRYTKYLETLSKYATHFHATHPDKRLVIWTVSHYDTISPYIKRHITKTDPHQFVQVDYGAGVSINIDAEGIATSTFRGKNYPVDLTI